MKLNREVFSLSLRCPLAVIKEIDQLSQRSLHEMKYVTLGSVFVHVCGQYVNYSTKLRS